MKPLFDRSFPVIDITKVPGFRYRGGKYKLRKYIARWCPFEGTIFADVFGGRGNMMFLMKSFTDYKEWFLNDIQTRPFFYSIEDYDGSPIVWPTEEEFRELCKKGDYSKLYMEPALMWDGATVNAVNGKKVTFAGKYKSYNPKLYRRLILRAKRLLKDVTLLAKDAVKLIESVGPDPDAFLYIDPPYLKANVDAYDDQMVNREAMINAMKKCKCRWLLSEYHCDDLVDAFGEPTTTIKRVKVIVPGKKNGQTSTKGTKKVRFDTECLWANYDAKPQAIDYGYQDRPLMVSIRILNEYESLTLKQWKQVVPSTWSHEQAVSEFIKLTRWPHNYYDGQYLSSLEVFNERK